MLDEERRLVKRSAEEGGISRVYGEGEQTEGKRSSMFFLAEQSGSRSKFHDKGVKRTGKPRTEVFQKGFLGGPVVVKTAGLVGR